MESDHHEMAARIASGVWWFWNIHGHRKAALEYFATIVNQLDSIDSALAARVLSGRSVLAGFDSGSDVGLPDAERAVEIANSIGEANILGQANLAVGLSHFHANRYDNAFVAFRRGHDEYERAGNQWGMGWATLFPAWIYRMQADVETSEQWLDIATDHFHAAKSSFGLAWALNTKGVMSRYRFEFEESVDRHEEALRLLVELGDRQGIAFSHSVISISLYQDGKMAEAAARWEQADAIERELGNLSVEPLSVGADIYRESGDLAKGLLVLADARSLLEKTDETAMLIIAETVADYAVEIGIYKPAAELVAYAGGERIRVSRPIPGPISSNARSD